MFSYLKRHFSLPVTIGIAIWMIQIVISIPYSIFELTHVEVLLIAAPLWIIPLIYKLEKKPPRHIWLSAIAGFLFSTSFLFSKSIGSAILILPWLMNSLYHLISNLTTYLPSNKETLRLSANAYLIVGILWILAHRLQISPLGFDPLIVFLTGVHFHYAGFILLYATRQLITIYPNSSDGLLTKIIIAGIPLVAIGITSTELLWPTYIEVIAVTIMTTGGMLLGLRYVNTGFKLRFQKDSISVPLLFILGGTSLCLGMGLAFCYGWRHVFIIETISIPWMYAVHGTCNAIGFAIPIVVGWTFYSNINGKTNSELTEQ